jgi:2,4-diaminopentanoate dehydrogenase
MDEACRAGKASLFVSGIDPGFINDVVPLALSGLCERIDEVRAFEIFNYELYEQPDAVRTLVGFGMPMDYVPPMIAPGVPTMVWGGQVRLMARGLGLALDDVREEVERLPLARDVENAHGRFERGTQGALRFEVQGWVGGAPRIIVEHYTRITDDIAPEWPNAAGGGSHGVRIKGHPNITLTIERRLCTIVA